MKRLILPLLLVLLAPPSLRAQTPIYFNLFFNGDAPVHAAFLPPGGGVLNGDSFSGIVFLADTAPLSGRILQLADDNSFQTIAGLNTVFAGYPTNVGGGGSAFDLERTVTLDPLQIQNLLAGKWYAEVVFEQHTYLGQFVPIPEPAIGSLLLVCAAGTLRLSRRHPPG